MVRSNLKAQVPWYTMILSESDLAKGQVTLETLDRPGPTFSCQYALRTNVISKQVDHATKQITKYVLTSISKAAVLSQPLYY